MNQKLWKCYRALRASHCNVDTALDLAREHVSAGEAYLQHQWTKRYFTKIDGTPASPLRYLIGASRLGLRMVGYADEICPRYVTVRGWHALIGEETTYRGAVFQVAGNHGAPRLVIGFVDSSLGSDTCIIEPRIFQTLAPGNYADDLASHCTGAACAADDLARDQAWHDKERDAAWLAGARYAQKRQEIRDLRKQAREIAHSARDNVTGNRVICNVLRNQVIECMHKVHLAILACRRLTRGTDYRWQFCPEDPDMRVSFNRGAEAMILT